MPGNSFKNACCDPRPRATSHNSLDAGVLFMYRTELVNRMLLNSPVTDMITSPTKFPNAYTGRNLQFEAKSGSGRVYFYQDLQSPLGERPATQKAQVSHETTNHRYTWNDGFTSLMDYSKSRVVNCQLIMRYQRVLTDRCHVMESEERNDLLATQQSTFNPETCELRKSCLKSR